MIFFVLALALVGFETMALNIFLGSWCYSVYLTINECSIIMYLFFLLMGIFGGLSRFVSGELQSFQIIGAICNVSMCGIMLWFTASAYKNFRKTGGIKGLNVKVSLPGEKYAQQAAVVAKKGANAAEKKLDKNIEDEKALDMEQ